MSKLNKLLALIFLGLVGFMSYKTTLGYLSDTETSVGNTFTAAAQFISNPVTPSPTPVACIQTYASSFAGNNQGTRKDGSAILADRTVPSAMFGAPQTAGLPSDAGFPAGSFFSLGFTNGNIILGFTNPFFNQAGNDLQIFEVTGGVYPDEVVKVEIAPTAIGPWTVVAPAAIRDAGIDINPIPMGQFVRLTDVSNIALFANDADAYDVDALRANCGTQ